MRSAVPRAVALVGLLVLGTWGGHAEAQGRKAPPAKKGPPPAAAPAPATLPAPPGPPVSTIPPLSETLNDGARREYEAAKALYAMNDSKGAFYKFQAAYELFADPRLLWNMATCAKNLHQYADALLLVRKYQKLGGGLLTDEDRAEAAAVERALAALTTTFVFRGVLPGAEVSLDDKPVERPQEPVVADLGPHRIAVKKPGFHPFQVTMTGRPMAEIPIDVQLAPELHQGTIVVSVVQLRSTAGDAVLQVTVTDSGIGIAKDKLGLIFEAFSQEDASTTRKYGGTGLGLTICKRLVELMGGEIGVDSVVGAGSRFHFTMHVALDTSAAAPAPGPVSLAGKRMVIVDDTTINLQILGRMVAHWGASAVCLDSAAAAQAWLAANPAPDVFLLDVQMPDTDGFALAEWIRAQGSLQATPVIILSSGAMRGDAQRCRELDLQGYFPKPVVEEDLRSALDKVLGHGPVARASDALVTRHALREEATSLRVLLVEDNRVNQQLALRLLTKWGHTCTLAQDGSQALLAADEQAFDVCLMDMQMPVMGGIECTQKLRAREAANGLPALYIIAMTANAMKGDREACLQAGMNDYLSKPIKAEELRSKLEALGRGTPDAAQSIPSTDTAPGDPMSENNFDYAAGLKAMDQEILEIIGPAFVEQYATELQQLDDALAAGQIDVVRRSAHSLKGTLASFHARPAQELATAIEAAAATGSVLGQEQSVRELHDAVAALVVALRTWNDNLS